MKLGISSDIIHHEERITGTEGAMRGFYKKVIYADSEYIASMYEDIFNEKPATELVREESKGAEASAYVFKGNLVTKQVHKYNNSPLSMLQELFFKKQYQFTRYMTPSLLTINKKFDSGESDTLCFMVFLEGERLELNAEECYFYNGFKNILSKYGYKGKHLSQEVLLLHGPIISLGDSSGICRPYVILSK